MKIGTINTGNTARSLGILRAEGYGISVNVEVAL